MKQMFISLVSVLVFLISTTITAKAQEFCPPPEESGCHPWEYAAYEVNTKNPVCWIRLEYKWRVCGYNYQIYIINITRSGNCEYLGLSTSAEFMEWAHIVIAEEISDLVAHNPVPWCPETMLKVMFYSASCVNWVYCDYSVTTQLDSCEADFTGMPNPNPFGANGNARLWSLRPCGEACCKKTYTICKKWSATGQGFDVIITNILIEQEGECTEQGQYSDECSNAC